MSKVSMSSPWVIYAKEVEALFSGDDDVKVVFDNDNVKLTLYVSGLMGKKAEAIQKLLPSKLPMGNVTLTTEVVPGNETPTYEDLVKAAFYGNDNFVGVKSESHGIFGDTSYGLFANKTAQFFTDDLTQYGGVATTTYADLANDVLNLQNGFYYSTEVNN